MTHHDVVVVGGGASGSVLAARLAEDPGRRVLLLEAGRAPRSIAAFPSALLDARRVPGAMPSGSDSWWYPAQLTPGRPYSISRGRVLGGSTTTNGGYFVRPRRADFDRWSAHGDAAWGWERVLPLLRALERDLDLGAGPLHGDRGPVPVRRTSLEHPAAAAFAAAAGELGFVAEPDKNGEQPAGVGPVPTNAAAGVRWNAALAYLIAAGSRPNLTVRGGCTVLRVVVRAGRARGVEVLADGRATLIEADEVVLSAGALASPAILLRSGIGPAAELRGVGVPVAIDAPAIGAVFSDHPQVVLEWRPRGRLRRPREGWMGALLNTEHGVEVLQSLAPLARLAGAPSVDADEPLPLLVSLGSPEARGSLTLASPDTAVPARIDFRYLSSEPDRRAMREAVRLTVELIATGSFRAVASGRAGPGDGVLADDRALDRWIAGSIGTSLHTCGTVPFRLPDGSAGPVDQFGSLHQVGGLRIADTSILPSVPVRGPAVAAAVIGELVAAAMRDPA